MLLLVRSVAIVAPVSRLLLLQLLPRQLFSQATSLVTRATISTTESEREPTDMRCQRDAAIGCRSMSPPSATPLSKIVPPAVTELSNERCRREMYNSD